MSDVHLTYEELLEMSQSDLAEQVRYLQRKLHEARRQETLRDKFAGQALIALIPLVEKDKNQDVEDAGTAAYQYADAMIAARDAKEGEK